MAVKLAVILACLIFLCFVSVIIFVSVAIVACQNEKLVDQDNWLIGKEVKMARAPDLGGEILGIRINDITGMQLSDWVTIDDTSNGFVHTKEYGWIQKCWIYSINDPRKYEPR
jgi:hypothetical protein